MCEACLPQFVSTPTRRRPVARRKQSDQVEVGGGLTIYRRHAWAGDDLLPGLLQPEPDVRFLLVHHTATATEYAPDDVVPTIRQIFDFHTGPEKNWSDICYNFLIDRFGGVWEARSGSIDGPVMADATGGNQGFAQLVCLIGDFTSSMPTKEAIDALIRVMAWLADRQHIAVGEETLTSFVSRGSNRWAAGTEVTTLTIAGHRDMSQTACPGDSFYPFVHTDLVRAVAEFAATSSAPTSTTSRSTTPSPSTSTSAAPTTVAVTSTFSEPGTTQGSTTTAAVSTSSGVPSPATTVAKGRRGLPSAAWAIPTIGVAALGFIVSRRRVLSRARRSSDVSGDVSELR